MFVAYVPSGNRPNDGQVSGLISVSHTVLAFSRLVLSAIIYNTNTQNVDSDSVITQSPSILLRPPHILSPLKPKVPPSFLKTAGLASLSMPGKAHVHQCRYIHTERKDKEKRDNKIVVGYFDFHSTIGIRTNTRPRSDAVITIKIYTTRRLLSLVSTAPQLGSSLACRNCVKASRPTPPAISHALVARFRNFTASWCVAVAARLHFRTPCPRNLEDPTQPKHQTA